MLNFKKLKKFDRLMVAIAFAEAGESATALKVMAQGQKKKQKRTVKRADKDIHRRPVLRA